jgi:hypothetical protein
MVAAGAGAVTGAAAGGGAATDSRTAANEACRSLSSSDSRSVARVETATAAGPAAAGTVLLLPAGAGSKVERPVTIRVNSNSGSDSADAAGFRSLSGRTVSFVSYRSAIHASYIKTAGRAAFGCPCAQRISSGALTPRIARPEDNTNFVA